MKNFKNNICIFLIVFLFYSISFSSTWRWSADTIRGNHVDTGPSD